MRPHFEILLTDDGRAIFTALRQSLAVPDSGFMGDVLDTHAYLRIPRERRSLLSPNLNLQLIEEDVALLSYVCASKTDYGALLRSVLDDLEEGN